MPDAGTHVPMVVYNPGKIKTGCEYNELFEFSDFLPSFADLAGIAVPEGIDGKSYYPLLNGQKQEVRKTVFVHYDPLKKGGNERWYGRFVRNKEYKLYSDDRFYNVGQESREKKPIPDEQMTSEEKTLIKIFQTHLNSAPPHNFRQPAEY